MHYITKTLSPDKGYSCVFRQWRAQSHCRFLHGYDLRFEITLGADELDACNWVYDFGGFSTLKYWLDDTFDHKLIVADDDPRKDDLAMFAGFGVADVVVLPATGCEAFAELVFTKLERILLHQDPQGRIRILDVNVRENGANLAGYRYGRVHE